VVLLFLLLAKATGFVGRSALVAGLFAVHPLNVESVAWVAERKTVLCTFFLLLALAAYGWYAKKPRVGRYLLVALLFALALMAKPMAITLPFMLLLVDFWPLRRFPRTSLSKLVLEKIPLLALSAASAAITLYAQRAGGAVGSTQALPLAMRVKNAIYSYLIYVEKTVWPSRLAVFYPHPEGSLALWRVLGTRRRCSRQSRHCSGTSENAAICWPAGYGFWERLIPVIGIVQVGRQAWADRYAYFPLWGLLVIAVWLLAEAAARIKLSLAAQVAIASAVLLGYSVAAHIQMEYWRDSHSLVYPCPSSDGRESHRRGQSGFGIDRHATPRLAVPHVERAIQLMPTLAPRTTTSASCCSGRMS
jgi:protein O-mannosyl-transferase